MSHFIFSEEAGGDYVPPSGNFNLAARETRDCLEITILSDNLLEVTEGLSGRLALQGGLIPGFTFRPVSTSIEITDTDSKLG